MDEHKDTDTPSKKILKITFFIVFAIFLGSEAIGKIKRFDPIEIDNFFDFAVFFGECLFSILAAALLGFMASFILAVIIEAIDKRITNAYNQSDKFALIGWIVASLGILCVLLYGVYSLYRPLFLSDLDKEREKFDPQNDYVYVTETGSKYHLSNCHLLKSVSDEFYIWDAEEEGYEPCSVCDPPQQ